jgi:hypothetical protein
MSKIKSSLGLTAPVVSARKRVAQAAPRTGKKKRLEAEKQALLALEQSLRLQAYTIRLPRNHPLFSGDDQRRSVFPSSPLLISRIHKDK